MRALKIDDPSLRAAVDTYADAMISIAGTEGEIVTLDKEVLGTEGRLIGRVTELLRELSGRRGRVLSRQFAPDACRGEMAEHRAWHDRRPDRFFRSSLRGSPHRPSAGVDCGRNQGSGRGPQGHIDSGNRCHQRDRGHRACRRSVSPNTGRRRRRARSRGSRAGRAAAGRGELSQAVRMLSRRHLCHDAGGRASECQSSAGADHGIRHAGAIDRQTSAI